MDSSRGSLISTVIMTVPLIIVPVLAMFPPAGGVSQQQLAADTEPNPFAEIDGFDTGNPTEVDRSAENSQSATGNDDFGDWFPSEETTPPASSPPSAESDAPPFQPESPFENPFNQVQPPPAPSDVPSLEEQRLLTEAEARAAQETRLLSLGLEHFRWHAGSPAEPVGLAVFVPGPGPEVSYRFGAVGGTPQIAADRVLQKWQAWKSQQQ